MNFKSKIFILGLITKIYAAKFSVISFEGSCLLNVGGQLHEMIKEHNSIPLYTTTVDVQPLTTYLLTIINIIYIYKRIIKNYTYIYDINDLVIL